ncbi:hypothetical protein EDB89DRAFT_1570100 [Lactarius sanguifluus]|nr:hypothetical protein EDB89DRAFT_1570100 [Lactarius sanguifluus]
MMPGVFFHELWKYQQRVRANITSDLRDFIVSHAHTTFNHPCYEPTAPPPTVNLAVPGWLHQYISSIGVMPSLFDISGLHMALTDHIQSSCSQLEAGRTCVAFGHARPGRHEPSTSLAAAHDRGHSSLFPSPFRLKRCQSRFSLIGVRAPLFRTFSVSSPVFSVFPTPVSRL